MAAAIPSAAAQAAIHTAAPRPDYTYWCETHAWATTKAAAIAAAELATESDGCNDIEYAVAVPQTENGVAGYYATVEAILLV